MSDADLERREHGDPRVRFAAERTLLAWIRTGVALMGLGFVVARFGLFLQEFAGVEGMPAVSPRALHLSPWIGTALLLLGVGVNLLAAYEHARFLGRLRRGEPYQPPKWSLGIAVAVVLSLFGAAMTAYLVFMV